jgi:hypothetical protein
MDLDPPPDPVELLRYITAGGDPSEIERAKGNLKSALLGYALAVLAPILLSILQSILGI